MIVALDQTQWDTIAQFGVWAIGFPLMLFIIGAFIWAQVVVERRENQRTLDGRWGLKAKAKSIDE